MKLEHKSGIYCIENLKNNKKYIGQSGDIKWRWMRHKCDLRGNSHHNRHLQSAWNKYGEENFICYVIEYCDSNLLNEKEKYWIKYCDTYNIGYNLDFGGDGIRGYKHTEEEIQKMRMIKDPEPIIQLDLKGNYLNRFISSGEAGDFIGKESVSGIKRCCEKDKYRQAYGYIWVYEKDYLSGNIDWDYYLNKPENKPKPVLQYDINMNLIKEWESAYSTRTYGFSESTVAAACNGKYNTYKGYIWVWKDNPELYFKNKQKRKEAALNKKISKQKIILQFNRDNSFIKEWTYKEIKDNGYNLNTIQSCCNGHVKTYKNYIWKYKEE